ncbi:pentapeptide repeat-containing protein [Aureimonas pseudogalii]|nr:pentapeptide repeat-containing protein [Aureimonas pseudogalii]
MDERVQAGTRDGTAREADGRLAAFLQAVGAPTGDLRGRDLTAGALRGTTGERDAADTWWNGERQGLDLSRLDLAGLTLDRADLSGADLGAVRFAGGRARSVRIEGAVVEAADFAAADLSGASFRRAVAGQASLREAMLEDAVFDGATMRFADLGKALLDGASFDGTDLWGASFVGADADGTLFLGARLEEADLRDVNLTHADFTGASLKLAKLAGSRLRGANFSNARLDGADLSGADLSGTTLTRLNLSTCNLRHARFAGAWIEGSRMRMEQIGGAVGEEVAGEFEAAQASYLALEANFTSIGAKDEASWAYKSGRRMGRSAAGAKAKAALRERRTRTFLAAFYRWSADRFVEWLCDYGESMSRITRAFAILILVFAVLFGLAAGLVPAGATAGTRNVLDLVSYSALNMMTANPPEIGLDPVGRFTNFLVGLQGAVGIILMGLFGYVLGNRIRR